MPIFSTIPTFSNSVKELEPAIEMEEGVEEKNVTEDKGRKCSKDIHPC